MKPTCKGSVFFLSGTVPADLQRNPGAAEEPTMGEQRALLSTLDDALAYFRRVDSERGEALTRLQAIERDISILRSLLPQACADPRTAVTKRRHWAAHSVAPNLDGLYNSGCRDGVLKWLAGRLGQDPDTEVRRRAALVLGIAGDTKSVPALSAALADEYQGVRRQAAIALGRIGTAHVVGPLAGALSDPYKEVRDEVTRALGRAGKPAVPMLVFRMADQRPSVRRSSSEALVMIGVPAISPLAKFLMEEHDRPARIAAVDTLGRIHSERAVPPLVMALMESDAEIQEAAAQALVKTGQPAVGPMVRILKLSGYPLRGRVAEVLVRMRGLAVKPLVGVLGDADADLRTEASGILVKIGRPSLGPLARALNDSNPAVRLEAATALGLIGDPRAVAPLVKAMRTKDRALRRRAAESLVMLGRPAAGPLVTLFKETDASLRQEASWALVQIGRPAFRPLCGAIMDADLGARSEAARVLSRLRSSGRLHGLHGEWERIVDEALLLAWFNSGWAQKRAKSSEGSGDLKRPDTVGLMMPRFSKPQKPKVEQPGGLP